MGYLTDYRSRLNEAWWQRLRAEQDLSKVQTFHAECLAQDQVIGEILELDESDINDQSS